MRCAYAVAHFHSCILSESCWISRHFLKLFRGKEGCRFSLNLTDYKQPMTLRCDKALLTLDADGVQSPQDSIEQP